jgi:hypothetical protein
MSMFQQHTQKHVNYILLRRFYTQRHVDSDCNITTGT